MKVGVIVTSIALLCMLSPIVSSQQPEPPGWELGIEYPQEDEDNPFKLSSTGTVSVSFFVSNNELLPITVDFEYEIPFEGEYDGPESETIGAGNNKTFTLAISGINVRDNPAETTEEFSITGLLVSRGSVPQPIPDSRSGTGDLLIPTIYDLEISISEPVGPMNSGSEMKLLVLVGNLGNAVDRVGSVEISDNCPLLTTSSLDELTSRDIQNGISSPLVITASQSHPQRNCEVEVVISSNGATNSGGSAIASDSVRVTVEPPPVNEEDQNDQGGNEGDMIDEVVSSNLPNTGVFLTVFMILISASIKTDRDD